MGPDSDEANYLENAFSILRFRNRGVVSFRRFVILHVRPNARANELHGNQQATQPLRVMRVA